VTTPYPESAGGPWPPPSPPNGGHAGPASGALIHAALQPPELPPAPWDWDPPAAKEPAFSWWGLLGGLLAFVGVFAATAAFGVPLGWLWSAVAPRLAFEKYGGNLYYAESEPEQAVGADAWFLALGIGAGVLLAALTWVLVRRHRGPVVLVALVLGCAVGAYVAWRVGRGIGLAEFRDLTVNAKDGWRFFRPVDLGDPTIVDAYRRPPSALPSVLHPIWRAYKFVSNLPGALFAQSLAAVFTYTASAGWSRYPSLRRPDSR